MKLVELKCKNCGAKLTVPENTKTVTCEFCNTSFQLDDEVQHIQYDNMGQSGYDFEKGRIQAQEEKQREYYEKLTTSPKSKQTAFILCLIGICGFNGLHEFYVGNVKKGIIKFLTFNWIFIGLVYDAIKINNGKFQDSYGKYLKK